MIKKFIALIISMIVILTLCACSSNVNKNEPSQNIDITYEEENRNHTDSLNDIGEEKAKSIVLEKVPGAAKSDIKEFKKDYDDGYLEYEGEILYDGIEYEFEISAADGTILGWEIDKD